MMSNHALSFNDHFFCTGWQKMPVFVFNIIYKLLLTSWTGIFLFNIMLTEVDTFTSITHHYSNAITQFITQFITQMPLLKSLLIITQMPFSLLTITPPLLKGHFADEIVWNWKCRWLTLAHHDNKSHSNSSSLSEFKLLFTQGCPGQWTNIDSEVPVWGS